MSSRICRYASCAHARAKRNEHSTPRYWPHSGGVPKNRRLAECGSGRKAGGRLGAKHGRGGAERCDISHRRRAPHHIPPLRPVCLCAGVNAALALTLQKSQGSAGVGVIVHLCVAKRRGSVRSSPQDHGAAIPACRLSPGGAKEARRHLHCGVDQHFTRRVKRTCVPNSARKRGRPLSLW